MKIDSFHAYAEGHDGLDALPNDRHLTRAELEGLELGALDWLANLAIA